MTICHRRVFLGIKFGNLTKYMYYTPTFALYFLSYAVSTLDFTIYGILWGDCSYNYYIRLELPLCPFIGNTEL